MRVVDLDRDMSDVIPTGTSRDSEYLFQRMADETLRATRAGVGSRILDSAAGLGQDSRALARRGAHAVCAEPSQRMTGLGRLLEDKEGGVEPGRVRWTQAWSEALPFRSRSFDAAFCKGALDHFDDPAGCIAEMARVTRADGRVVLAVANFRSLGCRFQRLLDRLPWARVPEGRRTYHVPSDHFTRYDPELLREQISRSVEIEQTVGLSLFWGVRSWMQLLERLPASLAQRLLELADAVARRFPSLADVLVISGPPRALPDD